MAKPDDALNLALAQLVRKGWPAEPPAFGGIHLPARPEGDACAGDAQATALTAGVVVAHRATCHLAPERAARFRDAPGPRTLVLNLIDAEPAVPLQLYWALANAERLAGSVVPLARSLGADLLLIAAPDDMPHAWRKALARIGTVRAIPPAYPTGFRRLLPRALRLEAARPCLVIDAVAAVDLCDAATRGAPPMGRPVAVASPSSSSVTFSVVPRGQTVREVAGFAVDELDALEHRSLVASASTALSYTGPRLGDHVVDPDSLVGDGELTFYVERRGSRTASHCIRCGDCIAICPARCDPVALLAIASEPAPRERRAVRAGSAACIGCGLCTAVCPSAIELHHVIAGLHDRLAARGSA